MFDKFSEGLIQVALTCYGKSFFSCRRYVVVPNVSWGLPKVVGRAREIDLLVLSPARYFSSVEIKISKEDLIKDKLKRCHKFGRPPGVRDMWFAVPESLGELALAEAPPYCGVLSVSQNTSKWRPFKVKVLRKPIPNKEVAKASDETVFKFMRLGVMRMWNKKLRATLL